MNSALIVMAIVGCGDAGDDCQTVRVDQARYVSVVQCNAAAEDALTRYTGLSYPVIAVRCQKASAPMVAEAALTPAG